MKKWIDDLKMKIKRSFCKAASQLRWLNQIQSIGQREPIQCCPEGTVIHLPTREDQELEYKLKRSYRQLEKPMDETERQ